MRLCPADSLLAERSRLGMDLHDGLLQSLAAVRFCLHAAKAERDTERMASIDCALDVIAREQQALRAFVEDLTRPEPEEDGATALPVAHVVDDLQRVARAWDCRIDVKAEPAGFSLPGQYAKQIGLLLREAVSNAVRHSCADRLSVDLIRRPGAMRIVVTEHHAPSRKSGTFKPRSLEARVAALNGSMSLVSTSDARKIVFVIPTRAF